MTTHIGLISDIHANPVPLEEALSVFKDHNVDIILCPGDISGYGDDLERTIQLLIDNQCQAIVGNHEVWYLEKSQNESALPYRYFSSLQKYFEIEIEGKNVFMVHAQPPDAVMGGIRLLNQDGELDNEYMQQWNAELCDFSYDILIVGHTHQVFSQQIANTLVINPGSSTYNHSCAILTLPELSVEFFALSNREIKKTWNWSEEFRN